MRRAAKVDDNQERIVKALRDDGCKVLHLHTLGKGVPDLLVCAPPGPDGKERMGLLEIKNGELAPSERKLTDEQIKFWGEWNGAPLGLAEDVDGALRFARALAFESCGSK